MYMIVIGCDYEREYIEKYGEHFNGKLSSQVTFTFSNDPK